MQMSDIYEDIKMRLCNNDHKVLEDITAQFISCKSIEMQKKILVLLLRNVRKGMLQKYNVLSEYNTFLMKIKSKQMKEGIYNLLYKVHNDTSNNDNSIRDNTQVCKWNHIKFEDKEVKVPNGYAFIDMENVVFYSPIENFVINYKSIARVNIKDNNITFNLTTDRTFFFSLIGDRKAFVERLKCEFSFQETKESVVDIYRTPNTSAIIRNEDSSAIIRNEDSSAIIKNEVNEVLNKETPHKRSSLSKNKLEFHSSNLKKFGKNLTIKIKTPKKEIFQEELKESVDEKSVSTRQTPLFVETDTIKSTVYDIKVQSSEDSNDYNKTCSQNDKLIDVMDKAALNEIEPNLGQLKDTTINKNTKKQVKHENNVKQEKIKVNKKTNMKSMIKYKIKTSKKMKKFVKALTKKRMRNLKSLHKLQTNNIKQKGKAFEMILLTFIKKYMRSIKQY